MKEQEKLSNKIKALEFQASEAERYVRLALNAIQSGYFLVHRIHLTDENKATKKDAHEACEYLWKAIGNLQEVVDEIYGVRL